MARRSSGETPFLVDVKTTPFLSQQDYDYFNAWVKYSPTLGAGFVLDLYTTTITQFGFQDVAPHTPQATLPGGTLVEAVGDRGLQMPTAFNDLKGASRWLDMIQKRCHDAIRGSLDRRDCDLAEGRESRDICDDPQWLDDRSNFLAMLQKWDLAFTSSYGETERRKGEDPDSFSGAVSMRLQWSFIYATMYTSLYRDYNYLVAATPKFRELVQLVKLLLAKKPEDTRTIPYSINGPVYMLYVPGSKCRDAGLRAEARRILSENRRFDGLWDARAASALCEWTGQLEADYKMILTDPEEIWNKIRDCYVKFHGRENSAIAGAERFNPETGECFNVGIILAPAPPSTDDLFMTTTHPVTLTNSAGLNAMTLLPPTISLNRPASRKYHTAHYRLPPRRPLFMHRAMSLDFDVVIEGELESIFDTGETRLLNKLDVIVQRGTNHAW
ncbi:uncharacterized protein BCR38DRAFT_488349 [Pseudomassariella vexata]|uniref:Uncharacterized protein n=1 Tax=Pseudomassariella vexata TaxID=1141098 RepID=A0A1Y2DLY4_9PEZI|nr:uncharacterized protein BCR38DRAFT_488349 [Pseudomassariella vexata]ORY60164.1 hypothetical protein BCR38DRAFT_488349 [Pseudomassariella vexata]